MSGLTFTEVEYVGEALVEKSAFFKFIFLTAFGRTQKLIVNMTNMHPGLYKTHLIFRWMYVK